MCKELIAYEKGEYSWSLAYANLTILIFNNAISKVTNPEVLLQGLPYVSVFYIF